MRIRREDQDGQRTFLRDAFVLSVWAEMILCKRLKIHKEEIGRATEVATTTRDANEDVQKASRVNETGTSTHKCRTKPGRD
jgi:hypothetical protein